jgi:hypothetical protein
LSAVLYGVSDIKGRLKALEERVLRGIFGPKRNENILRLDKLWY